MSTDIAIELSRELAALRRKLALAEWLLKPRRRCDAWHCISEILLLYVSEYGDDWAVMKGFAGLPLAVAATPLAAMEAAIEAGLIDDPVKEDEV